MKATTEKKLILELTESEVISLNNFIAYGLKKYEGESLSCTFSPAVIDDIGAETSTFIHGSN